MSVENQFIRNRKAQPQPQPPQSGDSLKTIEVIFQNHEDLLNNVNEEQIIFYKAKAMDVDSVFGEVAFSTLVETKDGTLLKLTSKFKKSKSKEGYDLEELLLDINDKFPNRKLLPGEIK
jgi:hypothetical protein